MDKEKDKKELIFPKDKQEGIGKKNQQATIVEEDKQEIIIEKDELERDIEALQFLTNRYIDNVWKHTGIHLFAAGWILSSSNLQSMLVQSTVVQIVLAIVFLILQSVHSFINIPIYRRIKELEEEINKSDKNFARYYGVTDLRFRLNELMILSIAVVAILFIWIYPFLEIIKVER